MPYNNHLSQIFMVQYFHDIPANETESVPLHIIRFRALPETREIWNDQTKSHSLKEGHMIPPRKRPKREAVDKKKARFRPSGVVGARAR
jgi:hypothetical protein